MQDLPGPRQKLQLRREGLLNQIHAADRHELGAAAELVEQELGPKLVASQHHRFTGVGLGANLTTIAGVVAVLSRKDAR
ncbi:hypothetical protein [Arthrobacter sp. FW306-07-I]|uniref:hypothetical protein n=1 Tax=Arthrobacter sp. FW306-07-I TaxID=2879622 RepID=UPI001F327026|nr:hypothetical protein [Arthrobacter sp. FW306-07-I]UKA77150.1 hypothetical protein LFT46_09030 [Arthrobacter sp. FW306-07-I]